MPLLPMAGMLKHAKENRYAIPAFNVFDLATMHACKLAAEEEDAPVIIAGADAGDRVGPVSSELFAALALTTARNSTMPMAVHVDHGKSFKGCMTGIRLGYTGVMIDASTLPFDENVAVTKQVVDAAHAVGVSVEAELGHVGSGMEELTDEMRARLFTKPDDAIRFVKLTGVDALAVSVGTLHGVYKFEPRLDFELLQELCDRVPACLVIHGGSGTPGLEKVARMGVTKINIATEIVQACMAKVPGESDKEGRALLNAITANNIEAGKAAMIERIRSFGANGHGKALLKSLL